MADSLGAAMETSCIGWEIGLEALEVSLNTFWDHAAEWKDMNFEDSYTWTCLSLELMNCVDVDTLSLSVSVSSPVETESSL